MAALMEIQPQRVVLGRIFCFGGECVGKLVPLCRASGPGAVRNSIKGEPSPHSLIHSSHLHLLGIKVSLKPFLLFL